MKQTIQIHTNRASINLALLEHTLKLFPAALATTGGRGEGVWQGRRISKGREPGEESWVGEEWAEGGGIEGGGREDRAN